MIVRQAKHSHETWYVINTIESSLGPVDHQYSVHFKIHPLSDGVRIWTCNCPDFTERKQWCGETCKHIDEVQYSQSHPSPGEVGRAKYGDNNWRLMSYTDALARRARRQDFEWKLESALESIKIVLEALRP